MQEIYDTIVVGAGPAGITAAIYLKRANLKVCIIEKETPGGQMNKTSIIENYPGISEISGPDLALEFYKQLTNQKVDYQYGEVTEIVDEKNYKIVKTNTNELKAKSVIIAVGRSPKKLASTNEERLEGKGISFCSLCDGNLYKGEEVAIVGGGNSALEEALYLSEICQKVTIIHRRNELRGDKILIDRIAKKDNIDIIYNAQVKEFIGENDKLESVKLDVNKEEKTLNVKACFIFIGYEPATNFLKNLDILDEKGYIIVDERGETKIKGIYAAGDIIKKEAYQVVTSASDGALAAVACIKDLNSRE